MIVDPDACLGFGECVALDPKAVELDGHGTARVLLLELDEERAKKLCAACSDGALSIAPPGSPRSSEDMPSSGLEA